MPPHRFGPDMLAAGASGEFTINDPGDAGTFVLRSGITAVEMNIPAGAETRILPLPTAPGMVFIATAILDGGGSIAITFPQGVNSSGNTIGTFGELNDTIVLHSVPLAAASSSTGYGWVLPNIGTVAMS